MKMNKIVIVMAMLLFMVPLTESINAHANTVDEKWNFNVLSSDVSYKTTRNRLKENDTSVYVRGTGFTNSLSKVCIQIYGAENDTTTAYSNQTYPSGRLYYYTVNYKDYKIFNSVHENSIPYAALAVKSSEGNGTANGIWSPDCAGESGIALMPY